MFPIEKRIAEWLNRYMVYIALGFVMIAALWMRMGGRNFVGNDYHYSLYDIPGNCNSLLYRSLAEFAMRWPDHAAALLKLPAYAGDFAVAFLALALTRKENPKIGDLRTFFTLAACLLSPVSLIYSVGGMEIDSVCMSLLLAGILLFSRGLVLSAIPVTALAAFLYPAYWPVAAVIWGVMAFRRKKDGKAVVHAVLGTALMALCLAVSVYAENLGNGNYFWGKIFTVNPASGTGYADFGQWFLGMCRIYGYFFAMGGLLLAFRYRKLRVPALALQILVLMYVGWQQTSYLAV